MSRFPGEEQRQRDFFRDGNRKERKEKFKRQFLRKSLRSVTIIAFFSPPSDPIQPHKAYQQSANWTDDE